ncbi:uncharacterized protein LOC128886530 [Hylaeus anthracinus]|uniref:uncharacterized protein LOC128886530 n=1 Tax=Hylaeus anthracinus TaxID=313031 RepID=UPI0023B92DFF|nr:uncharacterized protein LOC128886530 [Hylaeus anthracinus]
METLILKSKPTKITKTNDDKATDMDYEVNNSRKRKEERTLVSSDSETSSFTVVKTRRKKKSIIYSTEDETQTDTATNDKRKIPTQKTTRLTDDNTNKRNEIQDSRTSPTKKLINFLKNIGNELTQDDIKTIICKITEIDKILTQKEEENKELRKKLDEKDNVTEKIGQIDVAIKGALEKLNELRNNSTTTQPTYAQKVQITSKIVPPKAIRPPRNVITIYPAENNKAENSEETKMKLMANLLPAKEKLKIRSIRKISNNGVLIETETKDDLDRVLHNNKLSAIGLTAGLPTKKRPKMIIYDVPKHLSEKEITTAIKHQNLEHISKNSYIDEFKLLFKTGDRNKETVNWVIEVSPTIRNILKERNKIFIDWSACYIRDYIAISRCYKCQNFGHIALHCKATVSTCGHCAQDGHSYKNCPKKESNPSCINCKRANRPHDHSNRTQTCPAYKHAIETHIAKINYG